jgi:hypothetical protein
MLGNWVAAQLAASQEGLNLHGVRTITCQLVRNESEMYHHDSCICVLVMSQCNTLQISIPCHAPFLRRPQPFAHLSELWGQYPSRPPDCLLLFRVSFRNKRPRGRLSAGAMWLLCNSKNRTRVAYSFVTLFVMGPLPITSATIRPRRNLQATNARNLAWPSRLSSCLDCTTCDVKT